jgi:uncharacterized protein YndB with AHSA1/START domain
MAPNDSIERQMLVAHSIEVVWKAITDPSSLAAWFGDSADIDLRPGGSANFGWSEYGATISGRVEIVDEPHTFAFRWAALGGVPLDESPSTLVTLSLTADDDKTLVKVVETGFASLPEDMRERSLEENTSGWKAEFGDLKAYLLSPPS